MCDSTSGSIPRSRAAAIKARSSSSSQARGDQQDRVGAGGPSVEHLVGVDQEVLAEQRDVDHVTDRREVLERPAEVGPLREHRDGGGAGGGVGACLGDRIGVGGDRTGRRRRALHLGDQGDAVGSRPRR